MVATQPDPETLRAYGERLWEILDDYEVWPGRRLVGDDGSRAAWLIAQYSIEDPGLQKRCLEALDVAVAYGDADPVHYAYLLDRVRMADGLDQLYGSQFVTGRRRRARRRGRSTTRPWSRSGAAGSGCRRSPSTRPRWPRSGSARRGDRRRRSAGHERVVDRAPAVPRRDRAVGPERARRAGRARVPAASPASSYSRA